MQAYGIEILKRQADPVEPDCHGWCFGLPPGITPEQWPLDPANGYPLQHGFTLLLPDDHRCHGPDIVAISFFASPWDLKDGGPWIKAPEIRGAVTGEDAPAGPDLLPFWRGRGMAHPRLHRFEDILGIAHAAVLLTGAEFDGPPCRPPRMGHNPYLDRLPPPAWMTVGSGAAYWKMAYSPGILPAEEYGIYRDLGGIPAEELAWNRALRWSPIARDPNAGRAPVDPYMHEPTDYEQPHRFVTDEHGVEQFEEAAWAADLPGYHIGGTMFPCQQVPRFSPHYIEFGEELGGYNFGGGNAQLDFQDMKFDWACG